MKTTQLIAKEVKSEMTKLGIKVLRASQNKMGVLITIAGDFNNQEKALNYFNDNSMNICPSVNLRLTKKECNHVDFGTVFKWV